MFGERLQYRWQPICCILEGIASGMDYMHAKRICHGDLNPNNVLLAVRRLPACLSPCSCFVFEMSVSVLVDLTCSSQIDMQSALSVRTAATNLAATECVR